MRMEETDLQDHLVHTLQFIDRQTETQRGEVTETSRPPSPLDYAQIRASNSPHL